MSYPEPPAVESTPQLTVVDSAPASNSGVLSNLEVEDGAMAHGESCRHKKATKELPKWMLPFRYAGLAFLAVLLTITCPGDTMLWKSPAVSRWLFAFLVAYVSTVSGMLYVHRSDPGYLTPDMLEHCEDGLSLLGHNGNNVDGDEESCHPANDGLINVSSQPPHHRRRLASSQRPSQQEDEDLKTVDPPLFQGTRRKFCDACQFAPPLRAHHCKLCNRCVATYDHHCPLVGNCIGERNRATFWLFLLVQAVSFFLLCHVMGSSRLGVVTLLQNQASTEDVFDALRVLVSKAYLYTLTFMAYSMLLVHTLLAMGNVTTFEFRKGPRHLDYLRGTKDMDLPFSRGGCVGNVGRLCCSSTPCSTEQQQQLVWKPTLWAAPGKIVRDSEDWWEHPWQNKYWSCC